MPVRHARAMRTHDLTCEGNSCGTNPPRTNTHEFDARTNFLFYGIPSSLDYKYFLYTHTQTSQPDNTFGSVILPSVYYLIKIFNCTRGSRHVLNKAHKS